MAQAGRPSGRRPAHGARRYSAGCARGGASRRSGPRRARACGPRRAATACNGRRRAASGRRRPAAAPQAVAPAVAQAAAKLPVLVVGDNIGYHLAQGLIDTETDGGIGLAISRKTKDSSGLVREDFYDWQKNLRDILAGSEGYGAIVVMIGTNDRQELRDGSGRYEPLTARWKELYIARVDSLIAQLKAKGVPFFWVGLPIMRSERYSSDLQQFNEIYRARVEAAGGKYVDVWDAFADEKGQYNVFGPDVSGQIVKIRTSDGVHFTKSGQRKLAYFVEQAMRGLTDRPKPAADAAIAALPPQPAGAASGTAPTGAFGARRRAADSSAAPGPRRAAQAGIRARPAADGACHSPRTANCSALLGHGPPGPGRARPSRRNWPPARRFRRRPVGPTTSLGRDADPFAAAFSPRAFSHSGNQGAPLAFKKSNDWEAAS